jgi:hypothetical protein
MQNKNEFHQATLIHQLPSIVETHYMKTPIYAFALALASAGLLSCDKNDEPSTPASEYLPLKTGNYWQFEHDTAKMEVVGTQILNQKNYYLLRYHEDTTFYRIEDSRIYVMVPGQHESVKFRLDARVNGAWTCGAYVVTLMSKTDTIAINDQKIPGCFAFYFDVPVMIDEEYSIWLAPGIGFVQQACGECPYPVRKLVKARINGQMITFEE